MGAEHVCPSNMRSNVFTRRETAVPIESADATLRSRYAEQAATDLEQNRRQQEELTRQLESLRQEETLLRNILDLAEHPGDASAQAHVPHQAQGEPAAPAPESASASTAADEAAPAEESAAPAPAEQKQEAEQAPQEAKADQQGGEDSAPKAAKKTARKTARKTAGKPAKKAAPKKAAQKTAPQKGTPKNTQKAADKAGDKGGQQVLLRDLLLDLLSAHSEPRLAAELREELLRKHPDREPSPQVVRNTLESLVAKGRIQRYKQNRSVMYTVAEAGGAQADTTPAGEPVGAA